MSDLRNDERAAQNAPEDDEISLVDLFAVLLNRKKMIIAITVCCMIFALGFSIISLLLPNEESFYPNKFTPSAHLMVADSQSSSGGLSSLLQSASGSLGSLAGLMGVSTGSNTNGALALYIINMPSFLDSIITRFDLTERYKIKDHVRADTRRALTKNLSAELDDDTGVILLSFTDIDPEFACGVVNYAADLLELRFQEMGLDQNKLKKKAMEENLRATQDELLRLEQELQKLEQTRAMANAANIPRITQEYALIKREITVQEAVYTQMRAEFEVLKIQIETETPVFQIIEYAEVPDKKSGPSRGMFCIVATFAGFFISVFLAFLLNALENLKRDPVASEKLHLNTSKKNSKRRRSSVSARD